MGDARAILERISKSQNFDGYRQEHWQGTFDEYLDIVRKEPRVTRTAYQRLYDMILSYGITPVEGSKDGLDPLQASSTIPTTTAATRSSA